MTHEIIMACFPEIEGDELACAEMCQAMIDYFDGLGGYADKEYLTKYRVKLGNRRVEEIYNTLKEFTQKHYIRKSVYTDVEGGYYAAYVKREV